MPEPQVTNPPAKPSEPPVPPSPVGTDPTPPKPASPSSTPPVETSTPPAPQSTLSQEQIDELTEKASRFDLIQNDPELSQKIVDHYKAKTGTVAQDLRQPQEPQQVQQDPRVSELINRVLKNEVALFQQQNPEMAEHKEQMAQLLNQYPEMSLQDALRFSKALNAEPSQKPAVKTPPANPTAETTGTAGPDPENDMDKEAIQKKINDPKATPRFEDAIDLAMQEAAKEQSSTEEE